MYQEIFEELGLAKNEGKIYETLLREGESTVGVISEKSHIHRRNVYDSIDRLIEKGLVFQIFEQKENTYQAVEPKKLMELVKEKELKLQKVLPELEKMYSEHPEDQAVFMYRGLEGWKNYLRDVLRVGEETLIIGAAGASTDPRIRTSFEQFKKEAERKNIILKLLYRADAEVAGQLGHLGKQGIFKVLPAEYSGPGAISIFGDRVMIFSETKGTGNISDDSTITVIVNKKIAETFRQWFAMLWDTLPEAKVKKEV